MLQGFLSGLWQKYTHKYFYDVDTKLSLWSGKISLENLRVKTEGTPQFFEFISTVSTYPSISLLISLFVTCVARFAALADVLPLPPGLRITNASIKALNVDVPWSRLFSSSTVVHVDGLEITL